MTKNERMAGELLAAAKQILLSRYIYDPDHKKKPKGGSWHKTNRGWSDVGEKTSKSKSRKKNDDTLDLGTEARNVSDRVKKNLDEGSSRTPIENMDRAYGDKPKRRLSPQGESRRKQSLARSGRTTPRLLGKLAEDKDKEVRYCVARNPRTPSEALEKLAKDDDDDVRAGVAQNPNTPVSVLRKLGRDPVDYVRDSLAWNNNTPLPILNRLSKADSEYARAGVANNGQSTSILLNRLAEDDSRHVRTNVAGNENTPADTLDLLSTDDEEEVRFFVAGNESTSSDTLKRLAMDDDSEEIRKEAKSSLDSRKTPLRKEVEGFKRNLGPRGQGRDIEKLKQDFIRNMDPSKYDSPEEFREAKGRIMRMSPQDFDYVLGHILQDDDEDIPVPESEE